MLDLGESIDKSIGWEIRLAVRDSVGALLTLQLRYATDSFSFSAASNSIISSQEEIINSET